MLVIHFDSPSTKENMRYDYTDVSSEWKFAGNRFIQRSIHDKAINQATCRGVYASTSLQSFDGDLQPKQKCYSDPKTERRPTSAPTTCRQQRLHQLTANTRMISACTTLHDQPMQKPCLLMVKISPCHNSPKQGKELTATSTAKLSCKHMQNQPEKGQGMWCGHQEFARRQRQSEADTRRNERQQKRLLQKPKQESDTHDRFTRKRRQQLKQLLQKDQDKRQSTCILDYNQLQHHRHQEEQTNDTEHRHTRQPQDHEK